MRRPKIYPQVSVLWLRLSLLAVLLIAGQVVGAEKKYYPILRLDFGPSHDAAQTQEDFVAFTILDSGKEINRIKVELLATGVAMDSRWRWGPTGIPYELIYRDFIFSKGSMRLRLSGLEPGKEYMITLYSYDTGSGAGGPRWADWTDAATGQVVVTTHFDAGVPPTEEDSYAFSGLVRADENGVITLDCGPNPNTPDQQGLTNPFGFLNALVLWTDTPIYKSYNPIPEDGAIVYTTTVELYWQYGQTSVSSNIFFGESYDEVYNATVANTEVFRGNIITKPFIVGSPGNPYPEGLTPGKTYYWRTDEVEADGTAYKGDVWHFTVAPPTASNPFPVDGSLYGDPNGVLTWTPGVGSKEHHVYFGTNPDQVLAGTGNTDKGVVSEASYYPGLLEFNKTYYWRVDEWDGTQTHKGQVWSYTTGPKGLGRIPMHLWLNVGGDHTLPNLLQDPRYPGLPDETVMLTAFDSGNGVGDNYGARIYGWLYVPVSGDYTFYFTSAGQGEFLLSTDETPENARVLASEQTWGSYGVFSHRTDPIPLQSDRKYYIEARWKDFTAWDHCQVAWEGPGIPSQRIIAGNFLSPFMPVNSYNAFPQNGSTAIAINTILAWTSGIYAGQHRVYLGTKAEDINDVTEANLASYPGVVAADVTGNSYAPGVLEPDTTYYWRVDDVNNAWKGDDGKIVKMIWKGRVWSFTTGNYMVVDDFEGYSNASPNRPFQTWLDGLGFSADQYFPNGFAGNGTGSAVGHDIWSPDSPYYQGNLMETTITLTGSRQSMPVSYNNSTGASEISRTWSTPQDWTVKGLNTLVLNIYGDPNNSAEAPYVTLVDQNGSRATVTFEDSSLLQNASWQRWAIPLSAFTGVDASRIKTMIIGVAHQVGGSGVFYLDNILLTIEKAPEVAKIVYVDATHGENGNTRLASDGLFQPVDVGSAGSGVDGLWRIRAFANGGTIYESRGDWGADNTEDCPRLVTSVDVPEGQYEVFVYMWTAGAAQWRIGASLTNEPGELPAYLCNDPAGPAVQAVAEEFALPVPIVTEADRTMWQIPLGTVGPTTKITVYIDDVLSEPAVASGGNARTWYDGIGYRPK
ncbi:MAG: hypothetical protein QHH07_00160 [Sedimentisphaerales bacterium]|nr:hypothetical protein [Sedimentisphaerales bacterium]